MSFNNEEKPLLLRTRNTVIVALRLIVFAIIYLIILQERGLKHLPPAFWVITGVFVISEFVYLFEQRTYFFVQRILAWIFILDAALIGLVIYFLSVKSTMLFISYFAVIAIAAISKSVRASFIITFLISVFYLFISMKEGNFVFTEFITRPLFFFGVAIFASYLSEESSTHRKEQKKTEEMLGNIPYVGSYQSTLKGDFIYANEAFAKMLEYESAEELEPIKIMALYKNPEDRNRLLEGLKKNGQVNGFEVELLTKTGKTRNILISGILDGNTITGINMDITKRKQVENDLLESQRQIEFVLGAAKTNMDVIDSQFNLRYVDPEWAKNHGDWTGRKCYDYYMGRSEPCPVCDAPKVFETKQILVAESYLANDSNICTHVTSIPYQDKNGEWLVAQVSVDVTERKQTEKIVQESEEKYRNLVENINDMVQSVKPDGSFVYVNHAWQETLGYNEEEVKRLSLFSIIHPDSQAHCTETFKRVLAGENVKGIEVKFVTKDGRIIIVEGNARCLFVDGKPVNTYGIFRDITEHKKMEESLKLSEEKYRTIIENTIDIVYSTDTDGIIRFISPQTTAYGYTPEEVIGQPIIKFIHPDDVDSVLKDFQRAVTTGEMFPVSFRLLKKNGSFIYAEEAGRLVKSPSGTVNYMGIIRDITQQKKLEEQLLQSQKMEAVGRLAGGIAHDFNNIMAVINGYSSLILTNLKENDPIKSDIEEIKKAGERAAALTQQLLSFSRKQMLQTKVINLNTLIADMGKMLKRLIGENIKLVPIMGEKLANINADQSQIEQVIMNMVINARDAMPEGGILSIKTENILLDKDSIKVIPESRSGEFTRLSIQDTGIGMNKEKIDHVFEPFFTTKELGKGTGLGLATVYGIVKQHQGWINVYSEPGKGTVFNIYLPVTRGQEEEKPASSIDKPVALTDKISEQKSGGERILLVEDEEGVREFIFRILAKNGYQVFKAETAGEALDIFNREKGNFDLIFSDIVLPDKNGVQMMLEFLSMKPGLNVIFSSGYADEKSQWPVIQEKGFKFIQKPYTTQELLRMIKETIKM
jgi:PAS domain S-box-containing protein